MSVPLALALLSLLGMAAWLDLRRRQIPNWIVGGVALLWLAAVAMGDGRALWPNTGIAAAMLFGGVLVWRCGWLGGGDVKLIAALSLWAGADHLWSLFLATALSGGLLALAIVVTDRLTQFPAATLLQVQAGRLMPAVLPTLAALKPQGTTSLPYGVAVALGGCWLVHRQLA